MLPGEPSQEERPLPGCTSGSRWGTGFRATARAKPPAGGDCRAGTHPAAPVRTAALRCQTHRSPQPSRPADGTPRQRSSAGSSSGRLRPAREQPPPLEGTDRAASARHLRGAQGAPNAGFEARDAAVELIVNPLPQRAPPAGAVAAGSPNGSGAAARPPREPVRLAPRRRHAARGLPPLHSPSRRPGSPPRRSGARSAALCCVPRRRPPRCQRRGVRAGPRVPAAPIRAAREPPPATVPGRPRSCGAVGAGARASGWGEAVAAGAGSWFERREEISALGREFGIAGGEGTKQHQTLLIASWVPLPRPRGRCVAGLAGGQRCTAPRARRAAAAGGGPAGGSAGGGAQCLS